MSLKCGLQLVGFHKGKAIRTEARTPNGLSTLSFRLRLFQAAANIPAL